jgi:hypothetical protein
MQKWEYARLRFQGGELSSAFNAGAIPKKMTLAQLDELLARLGNDGWELVAASTSHEVSFQLFFKRPIGNR